ncbi:MAG: hypothetical protein ACI8X5_003683, partial [Planctomycetota bacterium]
QFVNVRLNIWLDGLNYERLHTLIGSRFGGDVTMANTIFCMFEPDAEGMTADSFPIEDSVFYGTRTGSLYPICVSKPLTNQRKKVAQIRKRRLEDLGEKEVDPELIKRILWESEYGRDGPGVAKIMNDLAKRYPEKAGSKEGLPLLPVMPDLVQAINFSAVDSRGVIAIIGSKETKSSIDTIMGHLLFEEGIAGRVHCARMTEAEWADAKAKDLVKGSLLNAGIVFLRPDTFGRDAEVQVEIPASASEEQVRAHLTGAIDLFGKTWRKLDRKSHLKLGVAKDMTWQEYDPLLKEVVDMSTQTKRRKNQEKKVKLEAEEKAKADSKEK